MKIIDRILQRIGQVFIFIILTVLTQVGGLIYLLCKPLFTSLNKINNQIKRTFAKTLAFSLIYLLFTVLIVPSIALQFGRVPLPVIQQETALKPLNIFTCLLNRHYVTKEMKDVLITSAKTFKIQYPQSTIQYLDANFPFWDGFSLLPHLSHNDGKKVDLAFFYLDSKLNKPSEHTPSFIGYGVYEEPYKNENNTPADCKRKGYWQYNILGKIVPQYKSKHFTLDQGRTKFLIEILSQNNHIGKIFIEPHLKKRLTLSHDQKIRFHGCQAVRHDDHIHIQLR